LSEAATVASLSLYSHAAAGNVRLAVYDNAAIPNLLWQSGSIPNTAAAAWLTTSISSGTPSSLELDAGTYWLAWQVDTAIPVPSYAAGTTGDGLYVPWTWGSFPAALDPAASAAPTYTNEIWSAYLTYGSIRRLTVTKAGTGTGTVTSSPAGINCGSTCSAYFNYGTPVTLTANADTGWTFMGWSGAGCSGLGTCQVTMTTARNVTATFDVSQPVKLLTARAAHESVLLEWANPANAYGLTRVCVRQGSAPTGPTDGACADVTGGSPAAHGSLLHDGTTGLGAIANTTTYHYAAFVNSLPTGDGVWSSGKAVTARPFDSVTGPARWAYSSGATALAPPGIFAGHAYYAVSNDRILHGMTMTAAGGAWPTGFIPPSTNGAVQSRPSLYTFKNLTIGGVRKTAFLGAQDGRVYAFDPLTGTQLWASPVLGTPGSVEIQATPNTSTTDYSGAVDLSIVGTRVSGGDSKLYGLNLNNGTIAWTFDNGGGDNGLGIITTMGQLEPTTSRLYFGSRQKTGSPPENQSTAWCVHFTGSGATTLWSVNLGDIDGAPIIRNGRLYIGTNTGVLYALNPENGAALWSTPYSGANGGIKVFPWTDTTVTPTAIYFSSDSQIHGVRDDGATPTPLTWSPVSVPNPSSLVVLGNSIYLGSTLNNGSLVQINKTTGALSSLTLGDPTVAKTVGTPSYDSANNLIIVGTDQGVIYAVSVPF
jgi:outer membrane protein assembly factor BamB